MMRIVVFSYVYWLTFEAVSPPLLKSTNTSMRGLSTDATVPLSERTPVGSVGLLCHQIGVTDE